MSDKGLEDAVVPAGDDAKQQSGKEDGGDGDGDHLPLLLRREELAAVVGERRGKCERLCSEGEETGSKEKKEP